MKHVVSYSGGIGSALSAIRVADIYGTANMVLLFADTLIEDEDLYRFNKDIENFLGINITRIADGRNPWQLFNDKKFIGNSRNDPCSKVLKRDLLWKWIKSNCSPEDCRVYLGIDWTESHRMDQVKARNPEWKLLAPMTESPLLSKPDMLAEIRRIGIEPPRLYSMGFVHNNCGGFCVKSGHAQFRLLLEKFPERYAEHEAKEQAWRDLIGKNNSILRDRRGKKTKPLTLKEFRERTVPNGENDPHEWGGCGCSID